MTVESLPLAIAGVLVSRRFRRRYVGRHHTPGTTPADYSPLEPADRQRLAPTYWANRQLPAPVDQRTGVHIDPAAVRALSQETTR